jgi:hypothetical protein
MVWAPAKWIASSNGVMQHRRMKNLAAMGAALLLILSCSHERSATTVVPSTLLRGIPSPERRLYRHVQDAQDWRNPYLVVCVDGIQVKSKGIARSVSLEELASTLAHLPKNAWPYGRIVAVQENSIGSSEHFKLIQENLDKVLKILTEIGVEADQWPP